MSVFVGARNRFHFCGRNGYIERFVARNFFSSVGSSVKFLIESIVVVLTPDPLIRRKWNVPSGGTRIILNCEGQEEIPIYRKKRRNPFCKINLLFSIYYLFNSEWQLLCVVQGKKQQQQTCGACVCMITDKKTRQAESSVVRPSIGQTSYSKEKILDKPCATNIQTLTQSHTLTKNTRNNLSKLPCL